MFKRIRAWFASRKARKAFFKKNEYNTYNFEGEKEKPQSIDTQSMHTRRTVRVEMEEETDTPAYLRKGLRVEFDEDEYGYRIRVVPQEKQT